MENDMSVKKSKALLVITYSFTTLLAFFFFVSFVPKLLDQYWGIITGSETKYFGGWEGIVMELTFYIFAVGYFFSFKKKATSGIIMIIASIVQMGPFIIIDGNMGSLIFGIPLLIAGILLLICYKFYRK